jgi:hypothetical protein
LDVRRFLLFDHGRTSNVQRSTSNKQLRPSVYARQTLKRKRGDTEEEEQGGEVTDKVNWHPTPPKESPYEEFERRKI